MLTYYNEIQFSEFSVFIKANCHSRNDEVFMCAIQQIVAAMNHDDHGLIANEITNEIDDR